jgi:hypothetical protein
MSHDNNLSTYDVSWQVSVLLPARMKVQAPTGLCDNDLIDYIRNHCLADFEIDVDDFEYDDGFADIELDFDAEVCDQD